MQLGNTCYRKFSDSSLDLSSHADICSYVCFLVFEIICIYFLWPETSGRTLEELAFLFEDKDLGEQAARITEKQLHGGGSVSELKDDSTVVRVEDRSVA